MNNLQERINRLTAKILNETLEEKANDILKKIKSRMEEETKEEGEWMEIEMTEKVKDVCEQCGSKNMNEGKCGECGYMKEETNEVLHGGQKKLDRNKNGKLDSEDFKMLRKGKKTNTDESETEEGNAFTGALAKAKKEGDDTFTVDGKEYDVKESKGEMKLKETIQLTEDELIDVIEKLVKEETENSNINKGTKTKGMSEYEKATSKSKKENDDYIKSVTKKMKDYLKNGSNGEYTMDPKIFPAGNGELKKMSKVAYEPSEAVQEYTDNFTAAGQENLVYDEIHPNDEWVTSNIEGSSKTGNNSEWANAVETPTNKKRNKIRKDNLLGAVKQMAYNKAPQPVIDDSELGTTGKFNKNFGKDAGKKASKILNQLESEESKTDKLIKEEFSKIQHLISYSKKTQ